MSNQTVTPVTDDTLPVTLVTKDASQDAPDEFYMEGLQDLWRNGTPDVPGPLDYPKLLALLGEPMSRKAWWHHRINRKRTTFGSEERNKLRAAIDGVGPIHPPVTDVTAKMIHPDAAVHWIGPDPEDGIQSRTVMLIAPDLGHIEIHVNGSVSARMVESAQESPVTPVISSVAATCDEAPTQTRTPRPGVSVTRATEAQNERRKALGVSWADVIEAGLKALQGEVHNDQSN